MTGERAISSGSHTLPQSKIWRPSIQTLEFRQMPSVWDLAGMPMGGASVGLT